MGSTQSVSSVDLNHLTQISDYLTKFSAAIRCKEQLKECAEKINEAAKFLCEAATSYGTVVYNEKVESCASRLHYAGLLAVQAKYRKFGCCLQNASFSLRYSLGPGTSSFYIHLKTLGRELKSACSGLNQKQLTEARRLLKNIHMETESLNNGVLPRTC